MTPVTGYIDGIGLIGPGLTDWLSGRAILALPASYLYQKAVLPVPVTLPPAERRRCGPIVKLSLAVGYQAAAAAGLDVSVLPTVFSASGGDGGNCHEICEMLASSDRQISPTRFHNSVHNAAAGYWSIATGAMAPSSVLCAYDGSFGAGLLEALVQAVIDQVATLLIAGDTTYPEPLRKTRPIADEFGVGLVLAPHASEKTLAKITVRQTSDPADQLEAPLLEQLRATIPAARSLPMLRAIANRETARVVIDYLDNCRLAIEVVPCR